MNPPQIEVTYEDLVLAYQTAFLRHEYCKERGMKHQFDNPHVGERDHLTKVARSVAAEILFARFIGIQGFVPSINTFKGEPDVPPNWEVKHSNELNPKLRVKVSDFHKRPQDNCVLLSGFPIMTIHGWLPIEECAQDQFKATDGFNEHWSIKPEDLNPW